MGTTWHVTYKLANDSKPLTADEAQQSIEALLQAVNNSMSTYMGSSEISRFNQSKPRQWFEVSPGFLQVLQAAMAVGDKSGGAYDVTVGPIVKIWGFGSDPKDDTVPDAAVLKSLLTQIGQSKLQIDEARSAISKTTDIALDFSSIAKGYGVDQVADWFVSMGVPDFLVEVGGEMRLAGQNPGGHDWRIAIEQPDAILGSVAAAITLTNEGLATSGDYCNYFEVDNKRYSHTIDPRTGYPITHDLVSVSVVHRRTMLADAWATAFMVLGAEAAMDVALERGLAVYLIQRTDQGYHSSYSPLFERYLEPTN